ncbi:hypothetical protein HBI56_168300 [Parastagonospora nodorum]|nr:hypothetical protein HBH56_050440 [Parastagonospora nodorum]KAH3935424.1 hypothetical protein HBH54_036230 [Parastagonospora nodorum]KAH3942739.1 hypothetical protein HBH53_183730 [Parastagonospora nodorum]KAH3964244.1 hypothetical protein HBH51_162100 [Parastagonospora nodorum]KAH3989044.1 hypothetical protein HBH52_025410 [Parastagonospora nodorum]
MLLFIPRRKHADGRKAHELDWSGFLTQPPDAEDWKPDPDSIPRTGTLKDARFSKDPYNAIFYHGLDKKVKLVNITSPHTHCFYSTQTSPNRSCTAILYQN